MITVAITTYNRADIVASAIHSALAFVNSVAGRVIVVDDGSTDETTAMIARDFRDAPESGTLTYVVHAKNLGVTAAKNTAFSHARPGWVLFLDSDDELLPEAARAVGQVLSAHNDEALVFFRCIDEAGNFVGKRFATPQRLSLRRYSANTSYGETLTAINKALAPEPPFDADLFGYEGIGCARLIKRFGPALLATEIVRRYNRSRPDRLSSFSGILKRAPSIARGHLRYISLFGEEMGRWNRLFMLIKAIAYFSAGLLAGAVWTGNG